MKFASGLPNWIRASFGAVALVAFMAAAAPTTHSVSGDYGARQREIAAALVLDGDSTFRVRPVLIRNESGQDFVVNRLRS